MPRVSLVGNGHGGSEDYATLSLWWAAESGIDYGSQIEAQCLGNCGSFVTLSGVSPQGSDVYTLGQAYAFNNESVLATVSILVLSSENTIVRDMVIDNAPNRFSSCLDMSIDNLDVKRVRIINTGTNAETIRITTAQPNSFLRNFVSSGGRQNVQSNFNDGCNVSNGIVFGAAAMGFDASSGIGIQIVTDTFSFGNVSSDFEVGTFTLTTSASEDLTGNITGYTSAELVDFANGDYRTKNTSFLATAGSGGSFIGAALEVSAGVTGTLDVTLADNSLIATGQVGENVTGTLSVQLGDNTLSAVGQVGLDVSGSLSVTLDDNTLVASGVVGESVSGSLSVTLEDNTLVAYGLVGGVTGSLSVQLEDSTLVAIGFVGDGEIVLSRNIFIKGSLVKNIIIKGKI